MYAPGLNSCVASNMRMLACGGPRNCNSKVTEAMKRLNCYRPYKEYANKLQDWRQAARSRDWVGTRFKGLENRYGTHRGGAAVAAPSNGERKQQNRKDSMQQEHGSKRQARNRSYFGGSFSGMLIHGEPLSKCCWS